MNLVSGKATEMLKPQVTEPAKAGDLGLGHEGGNMGGEDLLAWTP